MRSFGWGGEDRGRPEPLCYLRELVEKRRIDWERLGDQCRKLP